MDCPQTSWIFGGIMLSIILNLTYLALMAGLLSVVHPYLAYAFLLHAGFGFVSGYVATMEMMKKQKELIEEMKKARKEFEKKKED